MIVADFLGDDEINCSVFPEDVFGLPEHDGSITEEQLTILGEFNRLSADRNIVAIPCAVPGVTGVFMAKLDVELTDNDREVFAIFAEPVISGNHIERLACQRFINLLTKV
ncbi:hypothetical protein D3C85_333780 [compost metagenome]